jgi:hypothetical protein
MCQAVSRRFLKAEAAFGNDVRSESPSIVTCVEVKGQIDKCVRDNRRVIAGEQR